MHPSIVALLSCCWLVAEDGYYYIHIFFTN